VVKCLDGEGFLITVIGFERLYFKPKDASQELGVVLQTATS